SSATRRSMAVSSARRASAGAAPGAKAASRRVLTTRGKARPMSPATATLATPRTSHRECGRVSAARRLSGATSNLPRVPRAAIEGRPGREHAISKGYTRAVTQPLWRPTPERAAATRMEAFRRAAEERHGLRLPDYDALHAWSVREPEAFWGFLAEDLGLPFAAPPVRVRSDDPMPRTRWFEGATLSYA